jgi:lipopolysaccharide/colanic/teichoic acid biosynthesis glycosyltransferase
VSGIPAALESPRPPELKYRLWIECLCCVVGFGVGGRVYFGNGDRWVVTDEALAGLALSTFVFAISVARGSRDFRRGGERTFADIFLIGTGVNMLLQSLLAYVYLLEPIPLLVIAMGGLLSSVLIVGVRMWARQYEPAMRVMLLGAQPEGSGVECLGGDVVGETNDLRAVGALLTECSPIHAVVCGDRRWDHRMLQDLLHAQTAGVTFYRAEDVYEWRYDRVCVDAIEASDLRWYTTFGATRKMQALQAVYSNLIGLALLVVLSPLILLLAVLSRLAAGPGVGTVLEESYCAGFQGVPFRRFRFHSRSGRDGAITGVGAWLRRMRLTDLPELINVMRGEMSIIGPAPMRVEVAERLRQLAPFSGHRFTVRPGAFGWAQLHQRGGEVQEEIQRIEYDLFYLKEASFLFDFKILIETMLRVGR